MRVVSLFGEVDVDGVSVSVSVREQIIRVGLWRRAGWVHEICTSLEPTHGACGTVVGTCSLLRGVEGAQPSPLFRLWVSYLGRVTPPRPAPNSTVSHCAAGVGVGAVVSERSLQAATAGGGGGGNSRGGALHLVVEVEAEAGRIIGFTRMGHAQTIYTPQRIFHDESKVKREENRVFWDLGIGDCWIAATSEVLRLPGGCIYTTHLATHGTRWGRQTHSYQNINFKPK